MEIIEKLSHNMYYFVSVILFVIGFHTMLTHNNLIKKVMGMNIMDSSLFLFFVSIGYRRGGLAPIVVDGVEMYVNPVPSALILTGIVISVSFTAFALALIVLLYKDYGTVDCDKIIAVRSGQHVC
jgi:multicomponent Na+:H+ antiporter subunit C